MSHLELPRLVFSGRFISDVSTVNNEDANYNVAVPPSDLGWNPRGTATFDFYDCRVTGAASAGGRTDNDPVLGSVVSGSIDRSSAKMVDLDPDWQMSSQIWGLSVRVSDPQSQELAFEGNFKVSAFRDLFVRQLVQLLGKDIPNQQPAGGRYISVLTGVKWGPASERSSLLRALKSVAPTKLAIALNVFGYYYSAAEGRHTTGTIVGCVGPNRSEEPQYFVAGRRLQSLAVPIPGNPPTRATLIGPADAIIDGDGNATVDLGHALPISDADGTLSDISRIGSALSEMKALVLAVLPDEDRKSGDRIGVDQATVLGDIEYLESGWYRRTGGLSTFRLAPEARQQVATRPLALMARMTDRSLVVLNRETLGGLFVRADNFVQRLDPGNSVDISFLALRYGEPAPNQTLHFALSQSANNTPLEAISFDKTAMTDRAGRASLHIGAGDPGMPRPGVDGQIYALAYSLKTEAAGRPDYAGSGLNPAFDVIVAHIRTAFPVPDRPEWFRDIYPVMASYAQLYPIMSRHLFDLKDYNAMANHRKSLLLAFGRPIEDSNHMPVTRDLSENKRKMLIRWLTNETGNPAEPLVKGVSPEVALSLPEKRRSPTAKQAHAIGEEDVKRAMAIFFARDTELNLTNTPKRDEKA
jgi:hypothetical protein